MALFEICLLSLGAREGAVVKCMHLPQEEEGEDPCRDEALPSPGLLHLPEKGPCEDFFLDQPRW